VTTPPADDPTSVYLYYDKYDVLIYVGITRRGIRRQGEHNATKEWWPLVARQGVEHFATREDALVRERSLIEAHTPPFNKQHNPVHSQVRQAYLLFAAAQAQPVKWQTAAREMQMQLRLEPHRFGRQDHHVLRTFIDDADVAAVMRVAKLPNGESARVFGLGKKAGHVVKIEHHGPIALIHLSTKAHPILDGYASIKFAADQRGLELRNVHVRLDHSDPKLCGRRCKVAQQAAEQGIKWQPHAELRKAREEAS
jgi:hypothetical protein